MFYINYIKLYIDLIIVNFKKEFIVKLLFYNLDIQE